MSEAPAGNTTVAISGREMVEFRRLAIQTAFGLHAPNSGVSISQLLHEAGQILGGLLTLQPVEPTAVIVPGPEGSEAPKATRTRKPTTLKEVTAAGTAEGATNSAPAAAPSASTTAASAATSNSAPASQSSAPAQQAPSQPATPAAAPGSSTTASTPQGSGPNIVSAPVSLQDASLVLKETVQKDPAGGREFVKSLLKKYKVEIMSQIPAAQLADFVRDLKLGPAALAPAAAADPLAGLV